MEKRCPYCGTGLSKIVDKEGYYCPNHGVVEIKEETDLKNKGNYIG